MSDEKNTQDPWTSQAKPLENDDASQDRSTQDRSMQDKSTKADPPAEKWMQAWAKEVLLEQRRARRGRFWGGLLRLSLTLIIVLVIFGSGRGLFSFTETNPVTDQPHLGVIDVKGVISSDSQASAERVLAGAERAFRSPASEAVVLRINSPGGSPVQAGQIFQGLRKLRQQHPDKPLYAVIEDLGASGGYYVAVAADQIVADPASLLGSIGVISGGFAFKEAMERLGIERRLFTAGENKAFLDPFSDMDAKQSAFWQGVLDSIHQQFIDSVKEGRGERLAKQPAIFSGLVYSGEMALDLGLIDELGSLFTLQDKLGVRQSVNYTPEPSPWERFEQRLGQVLATAFAELSSPRLTP